MLEAEEMRQWSRLAASLGKRAGLDDPEALAQVRQVIEWFKLAEFTAGRALHGDETFDGKGIERPYSWAEIAAGIGVIKSAAAQRYGPWR